MLIRKASESDLSRVADIYAAIHTEEEAGRARIGWQREIYPTFDTARAAWQRDDLFVLEEDGSILGAAIINQIQVDVYGDAPWEYKTGDDAVCVLHTLVVDPSAGRRGLGMAFVRYYEDYAREHGLMELRMDTNEINHRARQMYQKLGYREIAVVPTVFNGIPNVNLVLLEKHISGKPC